MTQKLRSDELNVDRETVRICLKELDPENLKERTKHKLVRRIYTAK